MCVCAGVCVRACVCGRVCAGVCVRACVCVCVSVWCVGCVCPCGVCVIMNNVCIILHYIEKKLCKFKVCSTFLLCVFNSCFVDAGVMYTYARLVMYTIILTGYLY